MKIKNSILNIALAKFQVRFVFGLFALVFVAACSDYPQMEDDILDHYLINQTYVDLKNSSDEYIEILANSFGMTPSKVKKFRAHALSKKSTKKIKSDYDKAIAEKLTDLQNKEGEEARKDFTVNILAPYLKALSLNKYFIRANLENTDFLIHTLYEKFYGKGSNALLELAQITHKYYSGGIYNVDYLHNINRDLMKYGLFLEYKFDCCTNIFEIQDTILKPTFYKNDTISVLKLRRFIPGILAPNSGYFTIGSHFVIVKEDPSNLGAENIIEEMNRGKDFAKYADLRFNAYWRRLGLDLHLERASDIYRTLVAKDFSGKSKKYIKKALEIETVIHEAKHIADNIEHPELTLNIDSEFTAHITSTIFSPTPHISLMHTIQRMDNFSMYHNHQKLYYTSRKLWEVAIKAAENPDYTPLELKQDLLEIYSNYTTLREGAYFENLNDFRTLIVQGITDYYLKN